MNVCFLDDSEADVESEDSVSDTEYPEHKMCRAEGEGAAPSPGPGRSELLVEKSLLTNTPAIGEWERHTRVSMYLLQYNCFNVSI